MPASSITDYDTQSLPDEVDGLEARSDPRQIAAKSARLSVYWGNFGDETERYILFVGTKVAVRGPEGELASTLSSQHLSSVMSETSAQLSSANFSGEIGLHLEWLLDA